MTPQEAWSGKKPSMSHLHVLGSTAYVHVPKEMSRKLDDKSKKFVFIGYSINSMGYKLFNPTNGKIIISRDIDFDEESSWEWDAPPDKGDSSLPILEESNYEEDNSVATPPH